MFCGKCGANNEPGAAFCRACGAPLAAAQPAGPASGECPSAPAASPVPAQDSGRYRKIGIAAIGAVIVIVIIVVALLAGGRSDRATAEQVFDAVFEARPEIIMDLVPPSLVDTLMEEEGLSEAEVEAMFGEMADQLGAALGILHSLGDGVEITYQAVESEDVDSGRLSYLQEVYAEEDVDVSAARTVDVELRIQMPAFELDESETVEIPVVKVGRSWYLDVMHLS